MRSKPTFNEQMQDAIREYRGSGGTWPASAKTIARWMIANRKWERHGTSLVKICARDVARAMREDYYTDPQGRRVRLNHAARFPIPDSDTQETLWGDIRTEPRPFMQRAFSNRRMQIVGDCKQLKIDVDSYNDNGPKGPPVKMLWDFTDDIEVHRYNPKEIDPSLAAIVSAQHSEQSQPAS